MSDEDIRYFVICDRHQHLITWARQYKVDMRANKVTFVGATSPHDADRLRGVDWSKPNVKLVETGPSRAKDARLYEELKYIKAVYNVQPDFQPT